MTPTTSLISKRPDRCGGDACIRDLRIPVWAVVNYQRLGAADAEILQAYPSLRPSDLAAAYDYADAHRHEIEAAIRRNEEEEVEPTTTQNHESSETVGTLSVIREHIVSTPDTCGGKPRIAGSSVRVKDVVIWHDRQGMAPADIVSNWPHLTLASIYAALAYYHDHREEINAEIAADQSWYEEQKAKSPSLLQEKLRRLKATDTDVADDSLSS